MLKKIAVFFFMVLAMHTVVYGATGYIGTEAELIAFANKTSYDQDDTWKLTNDIEIESSSWQGIGYNTKFMGTFDGCGYVVTLPEDSTVGLFYLAKRMTIKNVTVEGNIVVNSSDPVGGLIRETEGSGLWYSANVVSNCVSAVSVENTGTGGVGGLIGTTQGSLDMTECAVIGEKLIGDSVGGLIHTWDKNNGYLDIVDSYVVTTVESDGNVLGFVQETDSSFWINSSTNEETSYCCMFLLKNDEYSLVTSLSPSGSDDDYCKVVSDPSVDKEDYDGYSDSTWLYVENLFPRLIDNDPYNIPQIMAAIVPIVEDYKISVRSVYGGTWSYNGDDLVDGEDITISSSHMYLTLKLDGYTRNYPVLSTGTYDVDIVYSREGEINSIAPADETLNYSFDIEENTEKSTFDDADIDEIVITSHDGDFDNFKASIDDYVVTLTIDDICDEDEGDVVVSDTVEGAIYFYDDTTLAMGEITFSLEVQGEGLAVQFYEDETYYCTTDLVPVRYEIISADYTGDVSITYYTEYSDDENDTNDVETTESDGAKSDGGAPSHAETYYFVAEFDADSHYESDEKTGEYTIQKVTLTETLKYSNSTSYDAEDFVYDGSPISDVVYTDLTGDLADLLSYGDYYVLEGDTYELTNEDNSGCGSTEGDTPVFVGSYMRKTTIKSDGSDYVEGTQEVLFNITQRTVNVKVVGEFFEHEIGETQEPTFTLYYNDDDDMTYDYDVTYYKDEDCKEEVDGGIPSEPGDYWYVLSLEDTDNLKLGIIQNTDGNVLSEEECFFTIGEYKEVDVTISGTTITWTGETTDIQLALDMDEGVDVTVDDFEILYYKADADLTWDEPLSGVPTDAGTYQFVIKYGAGYTMTFYDEDGIYYTDEIYYTGEFTIEPIAITLTVTEEISYEWDGTGKVGTYTITDANGEVVVLPESCTETLNYYVKGDLDFLDDNPAQFGEYTYVLSAVDADGNRDFVYTDNLTMGTLYIIEREDWSEDVLRFEPSVAYEMIDVGKNEGWQDQYGVTYCSGIPFYVQDITALILTKITE